MRFMMVALDTKEEMPETCMKMENRSTKGGKKRDTNAGDSSQDD